MPDTDDTGVVLAALGTLNGRRLTRELLQATDQAVRWLRDMQSPLPLSATTRVSL